MLSLPDTIVGHSAQRESLTRDLSADNVAHAYLLAGPPHVGKFAVAHWFAQQLVTHGLSEAESGPVLHDYRHLTHADAFVLDKLWIEGEMDDWDQLAQYSNVPQQHRSKAPKAKTDVISIDDIRALQERLHDTRTSPYRVCLIRSLERMQAAAANAFLKILEEPPERLVFLLTTEHLNSLLPTLVSRARVLRFQRLPNRELLPLLSGAAEEDSQFILRIAQGAPGIVQQLLADPDVLREHKQIHTQAHSFWKASALGDRLKLLEPLHKRSPEADQLLLHLALSLREQGVEAAKGQALAQLVSGLETNAHRQLLAQRFALQC